MSDWVHQHIIDRLAERCQQPAGTFDLGTRLSDLADDELDLTELLASFEDELTSNFAPSEELKTVGELIAWYRRHRDSG